MILYIIFFSEFFFRYTIYVVFCSLPSTGFDYWAALVGWTANQNKCLLPVSMSLPLNHLPLSKWVVRLGYFLAKSDVYTDTSIKQAIDVIKLNLILLLLKEHRHENRPFRHIERTTIIDEIASKRPPTSYWRKTKKVFIHFSTQEIKGFL